MPLPLEITPPANLSKTQRRKLQRHALRTVMDAAGYDWRPWAAIYDRESGGDPSAEHRLQADRNASVEALARNRQRYFKDNPYLDEPDLWAVGRGPGGSIVANHLQRWDPNGDPRLLHNPWIAAVISARFTAKNRNAGADTWAELNQVWSTGKLGITYPIAEERRERFRARLQRMFGAGWLTDQPIPKGSRWGTGPQPDQEAQLAALARAHPWEPDDDDNDDDDAGGSTGGSSLGPTLPPLTASAGGLALLVVGLTTTTIVGAVMASKRRRMTMRRRMAT